MVRVMGKSIDLTGLRFGRLTVEEKTSQRKYGCIICRCRCDCGNEVYATTHSLNSGNTQSCGCKRRGKYIDIAGQRYGKLTAIKVVGSDKDRNALWLCKCDCGGTKTAAADQLKKGLVKSCGCLSHPPLRDWVGKQFGELTVIAYDGKHKNAHYWKCRCSCGKETTVVQSSLLELHTTSCGCKADIKKNLHYIDGTCIEQIRDRKTRSDNTSGVRGVYYIQRAKRWVAQITFRGKTTYLGCFENKEDAIEARLKAERLFEDFLGQYETADKEHEINKTA